MTYLLNNMWLSLGTAASGAAVAGYYAFRLQHRHLLATKQRVRIGINRFPDSLPLLFAAENGFLAPLDVDIHFLNWPQAYDSLFNGTVDVIFGLKRISAALGVYAGRDDLNNGDVLCLYEGYAILLPPNSDIRSAVEIQAQAPLLQNSSEESMIKSALKQLQGKTICVMSWDTRDATDRLLSYAGTTARYLDSYDVNRDFADFLAGKSAADAFVGGVTQRLIGTHHRRCKELISEQHVKMGLGLVERAGLVWLTLPDEIVKNIEAGWYKAVSEINSSEAAKQKFVTLVNKYCLLDVSPQVQFSIDDLHVFWNRWEKFAASNAQSRTLQKQREYGIDIAASALGETDFLNVAKQEIPDLDATSLTADEAEFPKVGRVLPMRRGEPTGR